MATQRATRPDEATFISMLQTHQAGVYNLCYRLLGDAGEAEDAAQETFLRAYDRYGAYDAQRPLKTWLLAIAHHHCIDRLRRRHGHCLDLDDDALAESLPAPHPSEDPEGMALLNERNHSIQRLLDRLSPEDRSLVFMRYWYGLSYVEMADATGSTVGAVKSRLHRARCALGTMLAAPTAAPEPNSRSPRRAVAQAMAY
jgi:RNA polymerase sigma-70 factor, ECF subfamily